MFVMANMHQKACVNASHYEVTKMLPSAFLGLYFMNTLFFSFLQWVKAFIYIPCKLYAIHICHSSLAFMLMKPVVKVIVTC